MVEIEVGKKNPSEESDIFFGTPYFWGSSLIPVPCIRSSTINCELRAFAAAPSTASVEYSRRTFAITAKTTAFLVESVRFPLKVIGLCDECGGVIERR
ncbi:hypothetical protein CDAR_535971 [Caerostris darwini]|uniref:Uncharacterized protein n=1 Tax=Caerostris darwini TaxID=1538125 RepID=A0AAV4QUQ5_9ARAC|nr:hypothetical protein CDAR_535971 [Caerostris darwini]